MEERRPVISFAQNAEDVVLLRGLSDVSGGHYIDVGAGHPTNESVTRVFYDRGWKGINVEPCVAAFDELQRQRIRDVNLNIGIADSPGSAVFYEAVECPGSSTFEQEIAAELRREGVVIVEREVELSTLSAVFEEYVRGDVHFLKVDVEGFEEKVLRGLDWQRWRPWVVVVEATHPWTSRPTHVGWEPVLEEAGYSRVLFDGINRFYVRRDLDDLASRLTAPANVLDQYVPVENVRIRQDRDFKAERAKELEAQVAAIETELERARGHIEKLTGQITMMQEEIDQASAYIEKVNDELAIRDRCVAELEGKVKRLELAATGRGESIERNPGSSGG